MDLLIATTNAGKLHEYESLLAGIPLRLRRLQDVGLDMLNVEENATTVAENALIKAQAYVSASGLLTLADDTGLMVDALGGAPGVYPARYGGEGLTMAQRRGKVLKELEGVPDHQRTARFVCVIVLADPQTGTTTTVTGTCEGRIAQMDDEGGHGFGYDAVFIPQGYDIPWSRMALEDKNRLSHRGQAAHQIVPVLVRLAQH
jgi:XTP/dITP diphosphohydrolase